MGMLRASFNHHQADANIGATKKAVASLEKGVMGAFGESVVSQNLVAFSLYMYTYIYTHICIYMLYIHTYIPPNG